MRTLRTVDPLKASQSREFNKQMYVPEKNSRIQCTVLARLDFSYIGHWADCVQLGAFTS